MFCLLGVFPVSAKVSNAFGWAVTHLCPDIVVVDVNRVEPLCHELTASVVNVSSLQEPIEMLRSSKVVLPLDVTLDCTAPDGFTIATR